MCMSDLIDELLNSAGQNNILGKITKKGAYGTVKYELDIDKKLSLILHKAQGHYVTIKVHKNFLWSPKIRRYISNMFKTVVNNFFKKQKLAKARNLNVDKPRNLAKSVTVK